nr:EAL domain-containing protein [uncultured Gellertiella sp.]
MKAARAGPLHRRLLLLASFTALLIAGLMLNGVGLLTRVDNFLVAHRMALAPRKASGDIAFLAIDKQSLDQIGVWPWPRSTYGTIVDRLVQAGARDIAFDIDFSARSSPSGDEAFARALETAGGGVILPAFLQNGGAEQSNASLALTSPIALLADRAWVGGVNVVPQADGVLRSMPYGIPTADGPLSSIPVLLSGSTENRTDSFPIDFSISPATVPTYSVSRLLGGQLPPDALKGKSVLVGAYAVELKDYFTVPVGGMLAGPLVQVVAAETLLQHRVGTPVNPWGIASAAAWALALFLAFRPKRLTGQFVFLGAIALVFEAVGYYLFRDHALMVPTAAVHGALLATGFGCVIIELDLRRFLAVLSAREQRNTRHILEQVITDNSDAILIAAEDGRIVELSARVMQVFRPAQPLLVGDRIDGVLPSRMMLDIHRAFEAIRLGQIAAGDIREIDIRDGEGEEHCIEYSITPSRLETDRGASYVVCIAARDITERHRQEEALDRLSRYDALTGALRQTEFIDRLQHLLDDQSRLPVSVYSLNLHRFKTINATLGRDVGDTLLTMVVRTLETYDSGILLVGRTGGDSFCLARIDTGTEADAAQFADRLIRTLGVPFVLGENRAKIGVHIGFASLDGEQPADAAQLLDSAEFALDQARLVNGSGWSRFDPAASGKIILSRQVERELWRSLERQEISVSYQPQVRLTDRQLIGVEALVRWNHPELGVVSPGDFVEIAEANGFVEKLGQWVLLRACLDAMSWGQPITVAVNVSPLQFTRGDVVGDVEQALADSRLPPERLHLEITESTFLDKSEDLINKLGALKALGVSLALDDFGTGYSSFGYLAKFPLDKIKVDQMFVRSLTDSASSRAIVKSVRSLCQGLAITMICEGIETEAQLDFLRDIGCEQGQGWLFDKALPNEVIRNMTLGLA